VVVAAVVAGVLTVLAIRMFHRGTRLRP